MAKFIKFNITLTGAVQPAAPISPILVNVEDITTVTAAGAAGAQSSVVIGLTGRNTQAGYTTLTLQPSTSASALVAPAFVDGQRNPLEDAVHSAITANPGGVKARVQLPSGTTVSAIALA